ncbi:M20 family metallo-hydrolase [Desulfomonile tiedjei]|uniref:M20 family metallo-hydrolase n=1 Tax=Desulfomonile tiedjei TaxID=2358 RepID=UPI00059E1DFF|nr:M20 family metallo-hydrolase [Desulfomonile tiedjei]
MVDFQEIARKIDGLSSECTEFLVRICSIPALGPDNNGTGEMAKYQVVKDAVTALNPDLIEEIHAPDERVPDGVRPNLLAVFHGRDNARTLWILSHIDVVPPGEQRLWEHDPFKPEVRDGFISGRGVEDNGQAVVASIFAARAVKETVGFGMNVGLALVSDEETGSLYGLDYILHQRPDLFKPEDLILVPDAGNADGDVIEIAEKHLLHVKFTIKGLQGHASRPDKCRNTLRAAAHFVVELDELLHSKFNSKNTFFNPPESTFEPTRKEANVPNVNTIPGEDVLFFDCRILPDLDPRQVLDEMELVAESVQERFGVQIAVDEFLRSDSPNPTPADAPVVFALAQAVQEIYGVQPRPHGIGGQTVATFFRKRGLYAAVWEKILQMAHAPNERVSVENLIGNTKVFARMMV